MVLAFKCIYFNQRTLLFRVTKFLLFGKERKDDEIEKIFAFF